MKPLRLHLFCLAALVSSFSAIAQPANTQWVEGYYVNHNLDTIHGSIAFGDWNYNPTEISFQGNNGNITLTAANTKYVHLNNNETYLSYQGSRMINPVSLAQAREETFPATHKTDTVSVFLRQIFTSDKATLYILKWKQRDNFFIQIPGEPTSELFYKNYLKDQMLVEDKIYLSQIQAAFPGLFADRKKANKLVMLLYTESSMKKFFNFLFDVKETAVEKMKKYPTEYIVSAGVSANQYQLKGKISSDMRNMEYKTAFSPVVGVGLTVYRQRNFGRYFVHANLDATSYTIEGKNHRIRSRVKSGMLFNFNVMPGMNIINKENLNWQLMAGPSILFYTNNRELRNFGYSDYEFNAATPLVYTLTAQTSLLINKRLMIYGNFSPAIAITSFQYYYGTYTAYQAGVGYVFSKRKK